MKWNNVDVLQLVDIAKKAGDEIMDVYATDFSVERKDDKSPLTEADKRANAVILKGLADLYPGIPAISEETKLTPFAGRRNWPLYWLIDPLDGTKEFIKKNGEFTVNIALVSMGKPVLGVVYAPALSKCYFGIEGQGAFMNAGIGGEWKKIENPVHYSQKDEVRVVASRSHLTDETLKFVEDLKSQGKQVDFVSSGSSLKFCLVAEGAADVYPRFGPTMEWDTAAAQAVANAAGKKVLNTSTRQELTYNKENLLNPNFIVE
ncbi:MAG: 3'(2'),5'-bisphosphate nucleotidase CysQ [Candidatus Paceibacterales bacterium]